MKQVTIILLITMISFSNILGNGVCVIDASSGTYFKLLSSEVEVTVENQVAIIKTTQTFYNNLGQSRNFKYAFPLAEEESATSLRWKINNQWFEAGIAPTPQDTTLPGGGGYIDPDLEMYLGETPLYYDIEQPLDAGSNVIIELTYVNLLPYEFGNVSFTYPNNYQYIQSSVLDKQEIQFTVNSDRTIENLLLLSHTATASFNDGQQASVNYQSLESAANKDYEIQYSLSLDELGLFGLSTYLSEEDVPDGRDNGYFVFVAEPDPSENADVINKVFTLIVDRSGSMSGNKIVQARNAATFIVENLNEGDKFNIVDFATNVTSFMPGHVDFNSANETAAFTYISRLNANGSTNISGAFSTAVPQFSAASENTANIIIFFTDGQATTGITDTQGILNHVNNLVNSTETDLMLFTFGIGTDANEQLLTLLASQHNGLSDFLGSDELEEKITQFYLKIRNPVLLNTQMSFSPAVVSETYPSPLPSLYKGQQMIVAGRYNQAVPVEVTLTGEAFGQPVSYTYQLDLTESALTEYQFLTKIWAKKKIEYLLVQYYQLDSWSAGAQAIKNEIIELSMCYNVITPFTSFSGEQMGIEEIQPDQAGVPGSFRLLGNFPNPFNATTVIRFEVQSAVHELVTVRIYNTAGQLIRTLEVAVSGPGQYDVHWDGRSQNGELVPSGTYLYVIDFGNAILGGRMIMMK